MAKRRWGAGLPLACALAALCLPRVGRAQAPTIQEQGLVAGIAAGPAPGSLDSLLGPTPGSARISMGLQPGRDEMLLGRIGAPGPRVPAAVTMPGALVPAPTRAIAAPRPLPVPQPLFYGSLELPSGKEDVGPPDGLTLDQAIERLVHENLDLRAKSLEIPQARADVVTAGLRANPILYADAQLVPYGVDSIQKPDGPLQYDLNISHPLDYSHKRQARTRYAARSLDVMEAQYQDEVRRAIQLLYNAYVDTLAARQTVYYAETSVRFLDQFLKVTERLLKEDRATSADVDQALSERQIAEAGRLDAAENLRKGKRALGELLNLPPDEAERLELKGTIEDLAPPPPCLEELTRIALEVRPDLVAFRLGVPAAEANVRLQLANRFSDAYLLYQPFTYQNNLPYHRESGASWAIGITVPMPVYNRNQGNIERARTNVYQSQVQASWMERRVITEVQQAFNEYRTTRQLAQKIREEILPPSKRARDRRFVLFREGESNVFVRLEAQRKYIENVKAYHDVLVRHRRSMLALDTSVGLRVLP